MQGWVIYHDFIHFFFIFQFYLHSFVHLLILVHALVHTNSQRLLHAKSSADSDIADIANGSIVRFLFLFYWILSLFTFQMLFPFPVCYPLGNTLLHPPSPCFYEGVPPPTHPPTPAFPPSIPLHWGVYWAFIGPLLPLMHNDAILCYICSWSHVLSPWEFWGGEGWLILLFLFGCKHSF